MATKLYPRLNARTAVEGIGMGYDVAPGFWDLDTASGTGAFGELLASKGAGLNTTVAGTFDGPITGKLIAASYSYPLAAAATITSDVTFNVWANENSLSANAGIVAILKALRADGTLVNICEVSGTGTELGTTSTVRNWTHTPDVQQLFKGDRLLLYIGHDDAGGNEVSGFTVTLSAEGTTDGVNGDTYVEFAENLTFDSGVPAGTTLYLLDAASALDLGGGNDEKELWTPRGSSAVSGVTNTATDPAATSNRWTKTAGGNALEWYSRPIGPMTLSGKVYVKLRALQSVGTESAAVMVELARVDPDGSNPVVWSRQLLASSLTTISCWLGTSQATFEGRLAGADLNFVGHRIRLRVYLDDQYNWTGGNAPQQAGSTATLFWNGAAAGSGDSFITLTETVSEYEAPGPVTDPFRIQPAGMY